MWWLYVVVFVMVEVVVVVVAVIMIVVVVVVVVVVPTKTMVIGMQRRLGQAKAYGMWAPSRAKPKSSLCGHS